MRKILKVAASVGAVIITLILAKLPITTNAAVYNQTVQTNVFVNQTINNGHNRRFLAVGNFYDTTDTNYYINAESYLYFDLSNIPAGSRIDSAQLTLYRYANGGDGLNIFASQLTQQFNSNTGQAINDYRTSSGQSELVFVDEQDLDFRAYNWNVQNIVQSWLNNENTNYGFALKAQNPAENSGAAFCSSRLDDFCSEIFVPRLSITYTPNSSPVTPQINAPANNQIFTGNCDKSVNSGNCTKNISVTFQLSNISDPDEPPADLKHTILEYTTSGNTKTSNPIPGSGNISTSITLPNGKHTIRARSQDNFDIWGNYSNTVNIVVDTTPPAAPKLDSLPQLYYGNTLNIYFNKVTDNISTNITYQLEYSKTKDFVKSFKTGWSKNNLFKIAPEGIIPNNPNDDLSSGHQIYARVKAKDEYGNISAWSKVQNTKVQEVSREYVDTIPPAAPKVWDPFICGNHICVRIEGERYSNLYANNTFLQQIKLGGKNKYTLIHNWNYETKYTFDFYLADAVGNRSEVVSKTLTTPFRPVGMGAGGPGDPSDPWAKKSNKDFGDIASQYLADIYVIRNSAGKIVGYSYSYNAIVSKIPKPTVTYALPNYNGILNIQGISIANGQSIGLVRIIDKKPSFIKDCKSGISEYASIFHRLLNIKRDVTETEEYRKCVESRNLEYYSNVSTVPVIVEHSSFSVLNQNSEIIVGEDRASLPEPEKGRYKIETHINQVPEKSIFKVKGSYWMAFSYEGKKHTMHNENALLNMARILPKFADSPYIKYYNKMIRYDVVSEETSVSKRPKVIKNISDPLRGCEKKKVNSPFGPRPDPFNGAPKFHDGVDLATDTAECIVKSVGNGVIDSAGFNKDGRGNNVIINHENGIYTVYMHGATKPLVSIGQRVNGGTDIMVIGCTGSCTGTHVHLSLWSGYPWGVNSQLLDPSQYFLFIHNYAKNY